MPDADQNNQNPMSAVILAGGKSLRMEEDKSLLMVSGLRLIEKIARDIGPYFREIIISSNRETMDRLSFLPYRAVVDKEPNQGPLRGILTGLQASAHPVNFVMACDIPEINVPFLQKMMTFTGQYDIVAPVTGEGKYEPLFAFYHRRLIPAIETLLEQGVRKVIELYPPHRVKYIPMEARDWYYNLNTIEDYRGYMKDKGALLTITE
ncbi:MAG: molybdenum cofactor guanylyltransferase [Candidatus Aminicenantes bacterium]|nr:molybdenum cofactor guanylyltransferase [Candidatus Aminicenantes bacterium]